MPVLRNSATLDITNPLSWVVFFPNDCKRRECCKRTKRKRKRILTVCKQDDTTQHERGSLEFSEHPKPAPSASGVHTHLTDQPA